MQARHFLKQNMLTSEARNGYKYLSMVTLLTRSLILTRKPLLMNHGSVSYVTFSRPFLGAKDVSSLEISSLSI